jgi:hypothetical protein
MSFRIRKLYEEPIILGTSLESFDLTIDIYPCLYAVCTQLEAVEEPVYLIGDVRNLKPSFGDILNGFAMASQGNVAILQHPNLLELVIISESDFVKTSLHKVGNAHHSPVKITAHSTLETALAYVRSQVEQDQTIDRPPQFPNGHRPQIDGGTIGTGRFDTPSGEQQPL